MTSAKAKPEVTEFRARPPVPPQTFLPIPCDQNASGTARFTIVKIGHNVATLAPSSSPLCLCGSGPHISPGAPNPPGGRGLGVNHQVGGLGMAVPARRSDAVVDTQSFLGQTSNTKVTQQTGGPFASRRKTRELGLPIGSVDVGNRLRRQLRARVSYGRMRRAVSARRNRPRQPLWRAALLWPFPVSPRAGSSGSNAPSEG